MPHYHHDNQPDNLPPLPWSQDDFNRQERDVLDCYGTKPRGFLHYWLRHVATAAYLLMLDGGYDDTVCQDEFLALPYEHEGHTYRAGESPAVWAYGQCWLLN